ncbi:MAG: double zinc ribbon domain-containing protein [Gaiellaceae bacterium]
MLAAFPLFAVFSSLHDAFHSTAFVVARNLALFLAIVFWLALAYWVHRDARRRVGDPFLVGVATVLGLFPPYLGPVIYLLFRPAETLADIRSRRAELRALEQQLARARPSCPECSAPIEADYFACPVCATKLRQPCAHCDAPLEPLWQMCPYCASPIEPSDLDLDAALTAEALRTIHTAPDVMLEPEPSPADA